MLHRLTRFHPRRSLIRWTAITIVGAFLLTLLLNEIAIWTTSRRLAARIESIRAAGDPTTPEEILGPPLDDAENAAVPMTRAAASAGLMRAALAPKLGLPANAFIDGSAAAAAVAEIVPKYDTYEADLQSADALPSYRSLVKFADPAVNTSSSHVRVFMQFIEIERLRARFALESGDPDEACRLSLRLMRLSTKWTVKETLSECANVGLDARIYAMIELNRILQRTRFDAEKHSAIERELGDEAAIRDGFRHCFAAERALAIKVHDVPAVRFLNSRMLKAWANSDVLTVLDRFEVVLNAVQGPRESSLAELGYMQKLELSPFRVLLAPGAGYLKLGNPVWREGCDFYVAYARCLRIINECRSRDIQNPSLKDLRLPTVALIDPFNQKPLRLVVKPNGLLVYSVGANLADDGGDVGLPKFLDVGFGP